MEFKDRKDFELHNADFGESINSEIERWILESIRVYKEAYDRLFKSQVPEWRRICEGKPREKEKSWPWPNCANLVVQIVGQRVDDISARVMGLIWATSPVSIFRYLARSTDPHKESEKARVLEQFVDAVALDPDELDLYRVENLWFSDSARLGTAWVKVVPEKRTDVRVVSVDPKSKRTKLESTTTYEGPKTEKLQFEEVLVDPTAQSWEKAQLKIHIRRLKKHELEERAFSGFYDKDAVSAILDKPDRYGPGWEKQRDQTRKGVQTPDSKVLAEYDIYECWFWWYVSVKSQDGGARKVKLNLIWSVHNKSKTWLRRVFNFMPGNACAMIPTKLSISDEGVHGRGYADMLENFQDEVSTQHNQRIDARTMAITGILRSSNPDIDKNIQVYPFAVIPAEKDELELLKNPIDIGDGGLQDEELVLKLADDRAGVGPAVAGMGAGTVNKKGQYGSMGTLAVMQDSNSRVAHRISDFRHSHISLIGMNVAMYGKFGTGGKGEMFGLDEAILKEALEDFYHKRIRIPIRASTASVNKEVDKQNDMLLRQTLGSHNQEQIQLVQAIHGNQQIPPNVKKWMTDIVKSEDAMMMRLFRNFGYDQPREFVPELQWEEQQNVQGKASPFVVPAVQQLPRTLPAQGPSVPSGGPEGMAGADQGRGIAEEGTR